MFDLIAARRSDLGRSPSPSREFTVSLSALKSEQVIEPTNGANSRTKQLVQLGLAADKFNYSPVLRAFYKLLVYDVWRAHTSVWQCSVHFEDNTIEAVLGPRAVRHCSAKLLAQRKRKKVFLRTCRWYRWLMHISIDPAELCASSNWIPSNMSPDLF